jgi:hypothetical protein
MTKKERSLWIYERMNHTMTRPVEGCQDKTLRYGTRTKSREDMNSIPHLGRDKGYYETTGYYWRKFHSIVVRNILVCYDTTI